MNCFGRANGLKAWIEECLHRRLMAAAQARPKDGVRPASPMSRPSTSSRVEGRKSGRPETSPGHDDDKLFVLSLEPRASTSRRCLRR